jgi:DNA-binding response OmpR family regulator
VIGEHELAWTIKAASPATSVLMLAAVELDAEAGWASVDQYLIKPFPIRDLVAAVSALLPSTAVVR